MRLVVALFALLRFRAQSINCYLYMSTCDVGVSSLYGLYVRLDPLNQLTEETSFCS